MKIETLLKEANDYFVGKILNNEYYVKEVKDNILTLIIDTKYEFTFWTLGYVFKIWTGTLLLSFSDDEEKKMTEKLRPFKEEYEREKNNKELAEYKRLKAKYELQEN